MINAKQAGLMLSSIMNKQQAGVIGRGLMGSGTAKRTAIGAGAGALAGGYNDGWGGALGGGLAGGLAGGVGFSAARKFGASRLMSPSRSAVSGLNFGMKKARAASRAGANMYGSSNAAVSKMGGSLFRASNAFGNALSATRRFIGANNVTTNKYGGYALGAIGTAAAARIGSSVLSTNRGR